jgi:serine/threonine protein kinase
MESSKKMDQLTTARNTPAHRKTRKISRIYEQGQSYLTSARSLEKEWQKLIARHLPIAPESSIWRLSRLPSSDDPEQGWKIHISATVLAANAIFEKVAPLLNSLGLLFKAPKSLDELKKINCGLYYGFSQVGKFITVYPASPEQAVWLARKLHQLTHRLPGPAVPYDRPFCRDSRIYYRYGSFSFLEMENPDGTRTLAIRDLEGKLIPDRREPGSAAPDWATDPFPRQPLRSKNKSPEASSPKAFFKAYEAISQRGKGGVYRALDLNPLPARLCILKEGRRDGETDWDGRDGYWRVQHEADVLSALSLAGVNVPKVYASFEAGKHYYLVTEFIEGDNLQGKLFSARKKLSLSEAIRYGIQLAGVLSEIHAAGWVWRDCKPMNLIISKEGVLRPLDFEGACRTTMPDKSPWGTSGYIPPELRKEVPAGTKLPEDLYAFGATLHQLFSGRIPDDKPPLPIGKLRRRIPCAVKSLIGALLDPDPLSRPGADIAKDILESAYSNLDDQNKR